MSDPEPKTNPEPKISQLESWFWSSFYGLLEALPGILIVVLLVWLATKYDCSLHLDGDGLP